MESKISLFGSTGFIGNEFSLMYDVYQIERDNDTPKSQTDVLYMISTTHNYNVFDTPSSYEVTTKNMEIRSRVSQSLKDFNIDNLDNPADVKDQILAKAITTLVNQSSRISTAILALIKT